MVSRHEIGTPTQRSYKPREGAFSVIVKLCVIFGNLRFKLCLSHLCCQVPYVLDSGYNKTEAEVILQAMEEFHKYTSVKFVERTSEETR